MRELGRGGMGTVWLAERVDGTLRRKVALKRPHQRLSGPLLAQRLARDAPPRSSSMEHQATDPRGEACSRAVT